MDYKTFRRKTYTHYCNLTVALAMIPTIGNKKKRPAQNRTVLGIKVGFRLVVEHHRHDEHGYGFAVFETIYRR